MSNSGLPTTTSQQLRLDLEVAIEREVNGIGMGVLKDGTPYLNLRGLALRFFHAIYKNLIPIFHARTVNMDCRRGGRLYKFLPWLKNLPSHIDEMIRLPGQPRHLRRNPDQKAKFSETVPECVPIANNDGYQHPCYCAKKELLDGRYHTGEALNRAANV